MSSAGGSTIEAGYNRKGVTEDAHTHGATMYNHALSAALVIVGEMDKRELQKHELLSLIIFSIMHAMKSHQEENSREITFSPN